MQSNRIPQLDGLRGLAIAMVMLWHYIVVPLLGYQGSRSVGDVVAAGRLTWSGVDLFFVLSGFLIGGILLDQRESPSRFRTFYLRRAYRILPIYLLLCVCVEAWFAVVQFHDRSMPWWSYATFTQNLWMARHATFAPVLSYTWSLAVEEQFYLTLPWLIFFLPRKTLVNVLVATVMLAPVVRAVAYLLGVNGVALHVLSWTRADTLAFGVLAALAVRHQPTLEFLAAKRRTFRMAALLPLSVLVLAIVKDWRLGSFDMALYGYSALALAYCMLLLELMVSPASWLARLFCNRTLRWLGTISYGAYLLHQVVHQSMRSIGDAFIGNAINAPLWVFAFAILATVITLGVAHLSWTRFESKLVSYARRFTYEQRPSTKAAEEQFATAAAQA